MLLKFGIYWKYYFQKILLLYYYIHFKNIQFTTFLFLLLQCSTPTFLIQS